MQIGLVLIFVTLLLLGGYVFLLWLSNYINKHK